LGDFYCVRREQVTQCHLRRDSKDGAGDPLGRRVG